MPRRSALTNLRIALFGALSVMPTMGAWSQSSAPPLPNCPSVTEPALRNQTIAEPTAGQEHDVEVGGTLFTTGMVTIARAGIMLNDTASFSGRYAGADFVVTIPPISVGQNDFRNGVYMVRSATFRYQRERGDRHGIGVPEIGLIATDASATLRAKVFFGLSSKEYPIAGSAFEELRCVRPNPHVLQKEILYGGTAKGVLTLQYREFLGGLARPAFAQDATFDLAAGNEIAFKGMRLKILATSNIGARYVIVSQRQQ